MENNQDRPNEELQKSRSTLRESFLRTVTDLQDKNCILTTHEKNTVKGTFKGFDPDFQELLFDNLQTPGGLMEHAVIRGRDIISIEFNVPNKVDLDLVEES